MKKALDGETIFETIRQYVDNSSVELSTEHQRIFKRWEFAYEQLKHESNKAVISRIMTLYGVCYHTARKDVQNSKKLFQPINRIDCDWWLSFLLEDAKKQMMVNMNSGNQDAWRKARQDAIKIILTVQGAQGAIDPDKLGGNHYYLNVIQGDQLKKLDLDKIDLLPENERNDVIDILFEDVSENDIKKIMKR